MSTTATRNGRARYELQVAVSMGHNVSDVFDALHALHAIAAADEAEAPGRLHQWAFFVSLVAGVVLVIVAPGGRATLAAAIYAPRSRGCSASARSTTASTGSPTARRWMRRLDHSMIFMLIAGTYTPFALLVLDGTLATRSWSPSGPARSRGIVLKLSGSTRPKWLTATVYVALGWVAVSRSRRCSTSSASTRTVLVAVGGLLYTLGAVVYARAGPTRARGVRLPRDLPRAGDRGRGAALRGDRVLRGVAPGAQTARLFWRPAPRTAPFFSKPAPQTAPVS